MIGRSRGLLLTVAGLAATLSLAASPAFGAPQTFTVTKQTDSLLPGPCTPADCSLRDAVRAANATLDHDTIRVPGDPSTESKRVKLVKRR